jgi:ABC-type multidrug transport system fused ATPase/permease subunit
MMGFRSAVTGFSADGRDAATAMGEVIGQIGSMADESAATALAIDTFGSRAGAELAFAIRSGKFEIEDWMSAVSGADGTLAKTADAATTLSEKWQRASNSMSSAFSSTLSPAVNNISGYFAGLVNGIGDFLGKNQAVTAALIGLVAGLGVIVAMLAVYQIVTSIATVITAVFGTTVAAALFPITIIVAAVAALVAGLVLLFNWLDNSNKEFKALSATSKQHYEEVERLNAAYEEEVALSGENSEAAKQLAADLEAARAVYEANRMTLEEFIAENDRLLESHQKLVDSYNDGMNSISSEDKSTTALVGKLEELSSKTTLTATEQ